MKVLSKLSIAFLVFACFSSTSFARNDLAPGSNDKFYPTQADMLNYSRYKLDKVDAKYNQICNKIIKNFEADKSFVGALEKDRRGFLNYRLIERDIVLPSYSKDSTFYGSNYKLYSDSYLLTLTNAKIENLKVSVTTYCLYNDFLHNSNACSEKTLKKLFKY